MTSVSVIIPTFNSQRTLNACLKSLSIQVFPKNQIEIIVVDGESTDNSLTIASKYPTKVISDKSRSPETAKANALMKATHDYILFLPSDNVIPHKKWLHKMVEVLDTNSDLIAVYPRYYGLRASDNILTRYFSLFGANDPVAWFLMKADRDSYLHISHEKLEIKKFTTNNMPTLGDNGFLIRRKTILKADLKHFYHIDICHDLVSLGFNTFGIMNDSIIHDSGDTFFAFFKKKYRYISTLYFKQKNIRRYHVYNHKTDQTRLLLYLFYSITILGPLYHSIVGYIHKRDSAWFLHPVMCLAHVFLYGYTVCKYSFSRAAPK